MSIVKSARVRWSELELLTSSLAGGSNAGFNPLYQHLCRVAKEGAAQGVGRAAEVRMVEDVEELGPKPQVQLFREPKLPLLSIII